MSSMMWEDATINPILLHNKCAICCGAMYYMARSMYGIGSTKGTYMGLQVCLCVNLIMCTHVCKSGRMIEPLNFVMCISVIELELWRIVVGS